MLVKQQQQQQQQNTKIKTIEKKEKQHEREKIGCRPCVLHVYKAFCRHRIENKALKEQNT